MYQDKTLTATFVRLTSYKRKPTQLKVTQFKENEIIQFTNCSTKAIIEFTLQPADQGNHTQVNYRVTKDALPMHAYAWGVVWLPVIIVTSPLVYGCAKSTYNQSQSNIDGTLNNLKVYIEKQETKQETKQVTSSWVADSSSTS